jgi:hypothetical protein
MLGTNSMVMLASQQEILCISLCFSKPFCFGDEQSEDKKNE